MPPHRFTLGCSSLSLLLVRVNHVVYIWVATPPSFTASHTSHRSGLLLCTSLERVIQFGGNFSCVDPLPEAIRSKAENLASVWRNLFPIMRWIPVFFTRFSKERMMPVNLQGKTFNKEQQERSVLKAHRKQRVLHMCVYLFTFSVSGRMVNGLVRKALVYYEKTREKKQAPF